MKQHITWSDLRATDTETIIRLLEISAKEDGEEDVVFDRELLTHNIAKMQEEVEQLESFKYLHSAFFSMTEWLSIGKLIELISTKYAYEIDTKDDFQVKLFTDNLLLDTVAEFDINSELCDALWRATLYTLEVKE